MLLGAFYTPTNQLTSPRRQHYVGGEIERNLFYFSPFVYLQFNIAIEDQPDVLNETRKALQLSQNDLIANRLPLCVEISLQTVEGDRMILEVWSLSIQADQCEPTLRATFAIYNRMGILLKSLISVTRVTPAYKLSRRQSADSYHIYYRIYCGEPQEQHLGKSKFMLTCLTGFWL